MVKFKVVNFSQKLPKNVDTAVFTQIVSFFKYPQTFFWATFVIFFVKMHLKIGQSGHTVDDKLEFILKLFVGKFPPKTLKVSLSLSLSLSLSAVLLSVKPLSISAIICTENGVVAYRQ